MPRVPKTPGQVAQERAGLKLPDGYSTHQPVLVSAAIEATRRWPTLPIVELGCGHYSTPILAGIARAFAVPFQAHSSDGEWREEFRRRGYPVQSVDDWSLFEAPECSLLLVDNEQLVRDRYRLVLEAAGRARLVVLHDSNIVTRRGLEWSAVEQAYERVAQFTDLVPHTAVMGDRATVDQVMGRVG